MDKRTAALYAYTAIRNALDARKWNYETDDEQKLVHFSVNGDDLPMQLIVFADEDRQLVRLLSPLPFHMTEDKRMEGTIATCHATYGLTDGSFDYDLSNGRISFRMTAPFHGEKISEEVICYLIDFACTVVDKYNDKFFALNKGYIKIEDFLKDA